jgi:hypothetical protein
LADRRTSDLTSRDLKYIPGNKYLYSLALAYYAKAVDRRDEDHENNPEPVETAGCGQCADWMKACKRQQCARPWAPEW